MLWLKALSYHPIFLQLHSFLSFSRRSCCYIRIFPLHLDIYFSFSRTCWYILFFSFATEYTFVIFKEEEAEAASEALLGTLDYVLLVTMLIYSLYISFVLFVILWPLCV